MYTICTYDMDGLAAPRMEEESQYLVLRYGMSIVRYHIVSYDMILYVPCMYQGDGRGVTAPESAFGFRPSLRWFLTSQQVRIFVCISILCRSTF